MICFKKQQNPLKAQTYKFKDTYKEQILISEGGYGYVWKSENYAIKRVICSTQELYNMAQNEINIIKRLPDHPNLLKVIDYGETKIGPHINVCIISEYCENTLFKYLQSNKPTEKQIIQIFKQLLDGVEAMHANQIIHRDLKLENILLHQGVYKICDFGSSTTQIIDLSKLEKKELHQQEEIFSKTCTIVYRPPEMIDVLMRGIVSEKVDIWQLGCILYIMCFNKMPFNENNRIAIAQAIYEIPQSHISMKTLSIIRQMLQVEPKNRPSIKDIKVILYSEDDEFGEFQ
ncbi:BMP-2-inducible protein kinase [Paramecium bursaria]